MKDLHGKRFGRLLVVDKDNTTSVPRWFCECDCGIEKSIRQQSLLSGATASCGCYRKEQSRKAIVAAATYLWKTPAYKSWAHMKERCLNKKCSDYHNYGGRGIKVCDRWLKFKNFHEDMGARPFKGATLERIDVNGDYCPENCKWATRSQQMRNVRYNRQISYMGETLCLAEWAERYGLNYHTLYNRISSGTSIEKALTSPPDPTGGQFKKKIPLKMTGQFARIEEGVADN